MVKNILVFCTTLFFSLLSVAQEIRQFSIEDFDLKGQVKTCQVITDYGQEIFEFDVLGRLVKLTTKYNEEDKDITTYLFQGENLIEKRLESYKDNVLDLSSSMAHFYTIDSTANLKIREQILSYDKSFVEAQEYQFNDDEQLSKIVVSHENAVDEITIESASYKNERTHTYFENGVIQKSIRESNKSNKKQQALKVVLTKNYLDGEPNNAVEETLNSTNQLIAKELFRYDIVEEEFVSFEKHTYEYNLEGFLSKETLKQGNATSEKEYIFQFDDNPQKNWVKKIITPENSFTTRKITYYPKEIVELKVPD